MSDGFDYQGYAERVRAEVASQLRNPDFAAFESRFGCQIPPALLRLYELGEPLMDSPGEVWTGDDGLWIQEFHPLTDERVGLWGMYGWKFFAFAIGGESQTYLISVEDPTHVFVDYESDGSNIEKLSLRFDDLLNELSKRLRK